MPARLILVRHGQTDSNAKKIIHGQTDVPLNRVGRSQAQRVAQELREVKVDALYSSDLERAFETALAINAVKQLGVVPMSEFRERAQGRFEGRSWYEVQEEIPDFIEKVYMADVNPYGVETSLEVAERALNGLKKIDQTDADKTVMLVSHGGTIRILISTLTRVPIEEFEFPNTSITVLRREGNEYRLEVLAWAGHLNSDEYRPW